MRLYEGLGTALLALGAAWTQAGSPALPAEGAATLAAAADAPQDTTLANPDAPDAVGFDAATIQRVAEFELRLGTFADGLEQVAAWADEEDFAGARLLGQQLLAPDLLSTWRAQLELEGSSVIAPVLSASEPVIDWLGLGARTRAERAHVRYALGVVDLAEGFPERAQSEFEATRAAADDAGLRGDAIYNIGTLDLQEAELWRSQIPELGGQPPAAAPAVPGGPPAPGPEEEAPEPIEQARAYYLKAKDHYVERLQLDPSDADTRANTELVFRRLRELDAIEQQREEQEQEQEQNSDEQQESEDEQDQQQDPTDQEPQDQQQDGDPEQDSEPQDEQPEPDEPEEQEQEPNPEQEGETQEGDPQESEAQPQPRDEQYLTKEEVQRLLDRLEQHEELGKQLLERQRQAQQRSSARDW